MNQNNTVTTGSAAEAETRAAAVYAAIAAIPPGHVAAYGQVAEMAGLNGRARWVGRLLSQLPAQSQLPWYRVVRASGELGFELGSASYQRQLEQLNIEGIDLHKGRVPKRYFWLTTRKP